MPQLQGIDAPSQMATGRCLVYCFMALDYAVTCHFPEGIGNFCTQALHREQDAQKEATLTAAAEVDEMFDLLAFYSTTVPTSDQVSGTTRSCQ